MKVPAYLILVINSWLQNRTFKVYNRGHISETQKQKNGIPQGSSLSVLLWLVFVNDIPIINKKTSNCYVDDTAIWREKRTDNQVKRDLMGNHDPIVQWCKTNKVEIKYDKTK